MIMSDTCVLYIKSAKNLALSETIKSFQENCLDKQYDEYSEIDNINMLLKKYKYMIYIDNTILITEKKNYISEGIKIFNSDSTIKQVIFDKYDLEHVMKENIKIPVYHKFDFNDPYRKFEKINYIIANKVNPFPKGETRDLNMVGYMNKNPENFYYFKLVFSMINLSYLPENFPLKHFTIEEKNYAIKFEELGFKSCYLETVINKNETQISYDNNYDINDVTIVTGFIDIKASVKKKYYSYLECSIPTLSLPQNMVIFVHKDIEQHVIDIRSKLGLLDKTKIINITLEDLYMYDQLDFIKENTAKNISPYNNPLYIMAVNSRYKYIEQCIEKNYFNTNYFAWIDFGISHVVQMNNVELRHNNENTIRIAWICRPNKTRTEFVYNHGAMGGGLFMGHKKTMKVLCKIHDIEFRKLMNIGHSVNDDKLLYLIFEQYPELFDTYYSSYDMMKLKF